MRSGFGPWVGKIPGIKNGNPLQYSCLDNPMDRGAWPEQLNTHAQLKGLHSGQRAGASLVVQW